MSKVERIGPHELWLGDCREILPTLGKVDAVVSDPPYGIGWNGKVTTGRNSNACGYAKAANTRHYGQTIVGDDQEFDAAAFVGFPEVILWGMNHFPQHLSAGSALVWLKRYDDGFGSYLSDAEIAWMKKGRGVYCHRNAGEGQVVNSQRSHPTQKPLSLMTWCLSFINSDTILDPFMGSGTTGVACVKLGRKFIGIEIEEKYHSIACRRIEAAYAQPDLFVSAPAAPATQLELLEAAE